MDKFFAILISIFAYSILSLGLVMMKRGISWIGRGSSKKGRKYYLNMIIWVFGFIFVNISIIPNGMALKTLPPHIVSAIAGWGIIVMIVLSYIWLGEKLYKTDFFYFTIIVFGIFLLGYFGNSSRVKIIPSFLPLMVFSLIPFLLIVFVFIKRDNNKVIAIILSLMAGLSAGLILIYIKILVNIFGFEIFDYLSSGYFYIYLLFSLTSFVFLQWAYKKGDMLVVGPLYYSVNIVYTLISAIILFSQKINIIQLFAIFLIIVSLIKISSVNRINIVKNQTLNKT